MAHPFVHVELSTTDLDKAKAFNKSLFDWTLRDEEVAPGFFYTMIGVGEGTGGGMMQAPDTKSAWLPYVHVEDINAATARAKGLGATVCREPTEVMDAGFFSVIMDPTGATLGFWQPKAK